MDNPGELIRRAGKKRKLSPPPEAGTQPTPVQEAAPRALELRPVPLSRHGSYTALMRSHDRVATRHIPKQG